MHVLIDIGHPAHVHLFRKARDILIEHGHKASVIARNKEVTHQLLDAYGIEFKSGSKIRAGWKRGLELFEWFMIVCMEIKKQNIDIVMSIGSPSASWAAKMCGINHLAFNDTETAYIQRSLYSPASIKIFTPRCFLDDYGHKQIRYDGIHDLAYLRPEHFIPDPTVKKDIGVSEHEEYVILRFVSWDAVHDWGYKKTSSNIKHEIVKILAEKYSVFISAEGKLPRDLDKYRLKLPPHRLHDGMAFAAAVISDGATTATEAAVLGRPSLYISIEKFLNRLGCIQFLSNDYKLLDTIDIKDYTPECVMNFLDQPRLDERMSERNRLINNTVDVAAYIAYRCEEYGERG
ncbi:MAG: DUF354 domain-containing protein [Thermodesulfobacteriota bacterium]|nr:DUF354 domain-containing protein [Thermodesulfobacteriota bacterium]